MQADGFPGRPGSAQQLPRSVSDLTSSVRRPASAHANAPAPSAASRPKRGRPQGSRGNASADKDDAEEEEHGGGEESLMKQRQALDSGRRGR